MVHFEPGDTRRKLPRHLRRAPSVPDVFQFEIREAKLRDLPHIREIYNYYVSNSVVTFDEKISTHRYWREKFRYLKSLNLPFIVAITPGNQVVGYALVQPWASKAAYRFTVENSIYLGPGAGGKGLGTVLLEKLIDGCIERGLRELVAVISDTAEPSIALHKKFGFKEVGRMGGVGYKFGRELGTVYFQLSLRKYKKPDVMREE